MHPSVTIIMPIFNLTAKRQRNFSFLINNYLSTLDVKVTVAEQVLSDLPTDVSFFINAIKCPNISYLPVRSPKKIFHKSYILNHVAETIDTKYIWTMDADVFLRYAYILDKLDNQDVICPFENIFLLDEKQTEKFIRNKQFIVGKGKVFKTISRFGPLSTIIKTDIFKKIKMDEQYTGWGWEDLDFAYRIVREYNVEQFKVNGLHLCHEVSELNQEQEKANRRIFFNTREQLTFNGIKTSIPFQQTDFSSMIRKKYESPPRIIHVFSPALLPAKKELYDRETMAIESIIKEKSDHVTVIMVCDSPEAKKYEKKFIVQGTPRSSKEIDDKRGLPYLSDLFKEACNHCDDNDLIFYTNSDCCLASGIYNRLSNTTTGAVEYHRRDVESKSLEDVFRMPSILKETGVDGLAFRKRFYLDNACLVPDFFIGEPHWDTAICGALRTRGVSSQNTIDLYHPIHPQAWDPKNLNVSGKVNSRIYRDFIEYGISNIRLLSKPEEKVETSVVMVHYGSDNLRVNAVKSNITKLLAQDILNVEFVFVELVDDKTNFEELDVKPNWVHIVLQSEDVNKDIWQKEAMMNIGAKNAKGSAVIFLDSDVCSFETSWLSQISRKLKSDPLKIVHGYGFCQDSKYIEHSFVSTGLTICSGFQSDLQVNPGLVVGFSKYLLEKNNYLNPYSIMGGGDSIVFHEYLSARYPQCKAWAQCRPRIANTIRHLSSCGQLDYVECSVIHENHGNIDSKNYVTRHYATDYFTRDIKDLVRIGKNELLEWNNIECVERKMVRQKPKMKTAEDVQFICNELLANYKRENPT